MLSRKINIDYIVFLSTFIHLTSIKYSRLFKFIILNNSLNVSLSSTIIIMRKRSHSMRNSILFIFYRLEILYIDYLANVLQLSKVEFQFLYIKRILLFRSKRALTTSFKIRISLYKTLCLRLIYASNSSLSLL